MTRQRGDTAWISERFQRLVRSIDVVVTATAPDRAQMICPSWEDYTRGMARADAAIGMLGRTVEKQEHGRLAICEFIFHPSGR
jgi:Asp-tRNA(Asn)/Glu-tRNA(Gln) amidotransferase A subunit family amidase